MDIILKEDIKGLGYKNDIVKVKPGYGRNYLIPRGLAIMATESNKKVIAENIRQAEHKAAKIKDAALALASAIGELTLEIPAKAGETGKIFGAVTTLQISDSLKEKGFDIDRKRISFKEEIKVLGTYIAYLDLHKEVKHQITFNVVNAG
jgi:large subunit ribosomal protein L9